MIVTLCPALACILLTARARCNLWLESFYTQDAAYIWPSVGPDKYQKKPNHLFFRPATHKPATNMQTHKHTKILVSITARPPLLVCGWVVCPSIFSVLKPNRSQWVPKGGDSEQNVSTELSAACNSETTNYSKTTANKTQINGNRGKRLKLL